MTDLSKILTTDPTLEQIDLATVQSNASKIRKPPYLGASTIGDLCERKLWLNLRMAKPEQFTAPQLYRFEDGYRAEDIMANRFARAGFNVKTVDPATGFQYGISLVDGHLRGRIDGRITGLLQAPQTEHVWEVKSCDEKKQAELEKLKNQFGEKEALKEWNVLYYAQAILYMHALNLTRHYLVCTSAGARNTIAIRTESNPDYANKLIVKAERIKNSNQLPCGLGENAYQCKMCNFHSLCYENHVAKANCRTCLHSTPATDGEWQCVKFGNQNIPQNFQEKGCDEHLFIPSLIPYAKPIGANQEQNWVEYQKADGATFKNGKGFYTSQELHAAQDCNAIGDVGVDTIKSVFGAEVVA